MKKLQRFLLILAAIGLAVPNLLGQAAGPQRISAWSNTGVFTLGGTANGLTNLTTAQKNKLRLNGQGFAIGGTIGSTVALSVTNVIIFLEYSVDGTTAFTDTSPVASKIHQVVVVPDGVGGHRFGTNIAAMYTSGYDWVAVNSITNGNGTNQIFFTNLVLRVPTA